MIKKTFTIAMLTLLFFSACKQSATTESTEITKTETTETVENDVDNIIKTNEIKPNIELQSIHKDTLEVITYLRNKPLKEVWIRINK